MNINWKDLKSRRFWIATVFTILAVELLLIPYNNPLFRLIGIDLFATRLFNILPPSVIFSAILFWIVYLIYKKKVI